MATNTAASFTSHTGNNTAGPFSISFSYLSEDEIDVTVDGVLKTKTTHYTFPSATTISFTSGNHPANSAAIKFQRDTNISAKKVDFVDGAILTESDLDTNTEHLLFGLQEVLNHVDTKVFTSSQIADSAITTTEVADASITAAKLHGDTVVINSEQAGATANDTSFFTTLASDSRYFRQHSSETILSGVSWSSSDGYVASTAAIDARIIDLVDDVGGFVPIANETSFPDTNPDVNNNAGTLISIKALASNLVSNGSGVATISNGNASNNATITINGLANSTTYAAGFGMIVETTSTLHTYTFHRQTPKATEVTTVAGSISNVNTVAGAVTNINTVATNIAAVNSFANTYSIASSDPTTGLNTGDLYFNTTGNELKVYNGSAWQGGVTATGDLLSKTSDLLDEDNFASNSATKIASQQSIKAYVDANTSSGLSLIDEDNFASNSATQPPSQQSVKAYVDTADALKANLGGATFTGNIVLGDNVKAQFGTGNDAEIYFDTSNLYIKETTGSGDIYIESDDIYLRNNGGTATMASFKSGAEVELYHNGSLQCKTASYGLDFADNKRADFGSSSDLLIYHDGSHSYITNAGTGRLYINASQINLHNKAVTENMLKAVEDGAVELYYDNSKKFETMSSGVAVIGGIDVANGNIYLRDNYKYQCGLGNDLQIYHDGSNSYLVNTTGDLQINSQGDDLLLQAADDIYLMPQGNDAGVTIKGNGAVELYYDSSKKLATESAGVAIWNGNIRIPNDTYKMTFGASDDLQIYHDGSHSYIKDTWNDLRIESDTLELRTITGSETYIKGTLNGAVELYYDNVKKFETTSGGTKITGQQLIYQGSSGGTANTGSGLTLEDNNDHFLQFLSPNNKEVGILFGDDADNNVGYIVYNHSTDVLAIGTNAAQRIQIDSSGNLKIPNDTGKIQLGTGNDLQLYHDGSNSYIKDSGTGALRILTDLFQVRYAGNNGEIIYATAYGSVQLYYDDSKKLETTSGGVNVVGALTVNGSALGGGVSSDAQNNTVGGTNAGDSFTGTDATNNTLFGYNAGTAITSGNRNTYLGYQTGYTMTTGSDNIAIGQCLQSATTGSKSIAIGNGAGNGISTGSGNIAIGDMAIGQGTLTEGGNICIGTYAGYDLTEGFNNTFVGYTAGFDCTTGQRNTCIGEDAGKNLTTGSNNTFLGKVAGYSGSPSGNVTTTSNIICLGNNAVTQLYCNDTSISSSDKRDKTDVADFTHGLSWVNKLKPVTYRWDKRTWYDEYNEDGSLKTAGTPDGSKKTARQHIGFLAQDVLAIEQADGYASKKDDMLVVNINEDETGYGLKYERLVPVLVNAIKELSTKVETLETKVAALESA